MKPKIVPISVPFVAATLFGGQNALADVDEYVKRPDPAFAWKVGRTRKTDQGTIIEIRLTSQVWQGVVWQHWLEIYEPEEVAYPHATLLFVTGGTHASRPGEHDAEQGFELAKLCGARCAVLHQVPNQPLLDGKHEDDLIAETFVRYLDTKDATWPLLFPMVKSAVRAMDAVQAWAKQEGKPEARSFVVSGASKRGWTTWLTGAVDRRVVGIAPMVIVTLNMRAQNPHQLEVWGKFSEQIADYTRRGLTERLETPEGLKLWRMIDPYSYLDRLTMPKFLINGTNDRYWTLDALNLYWDDLRGPKYVVYLPNAGHGLEQHRHYATDGLGAFFRATVSNRPFPQLHWKHAATPEGAFRLSVSSSTPPVRAQLWTARSDTMDFRESRWSSTPMLEAGHALNGDIPIPERGHVATFGDLEYQIDGIPYHLSTQIRLTGPNGTK